MSTPPWLRVALVRALELAMLSIAASSSDKILASANDCSLAAPGCLKQLNASSGFDWVDEDVVMKHGSTMMDKFGVDKGRASFAAAGISGEAWTRRFVDAYCETWDSAPFPDSGKALPEMQARLAALRTNNSLEPILVHVDSLRDGIGARFKKALQIVAAGLRMGFYGVALAFASTGGSFHMAGYSTVNGAPEVDPAVSPPWGNIPIWCHESSAKKGQNGQTFPLACWHFHLPRDLLAQSFEPEGRTLLWGAPPEKVVLLHDSQRSTPRFNCLGFQAEGKKDDEDNTESDAPWKFLLREGLPLVIRKALMASVRTFAAPYIEQPPRREAQCGFGADPTTGARKSQLHVAVHLRRGDVSDDSPYTVTNQLGEKGLRRWICKLASSLGATEENKLLMVHVYTESIGQTRTSLRKYAPPGFSFAAEETDDVAPIYHALGSFSPALECKNVSPQVHWIVNNNPREAALCMARADVLVTSHSSLSWVAAVLNTGVVFHPKQRTSETVHWDLRDQYLDWAENWFPLDAVDEDEAAVQKAFQRPLEL